MRTAPTLVALVLLAALPIVQAQQPVDECSRQCSPTDPDVNEVVARTEGPVNVILYGHFEDILNRAPMNTVPPDPVNEPDLDDGFFTPTLDADTGLCPAGFCLDARFGLSEFAMVACPGPVEFLSEGWRVLCHAPGFGAPQVVGPIVLYVYFSVDAGPRQYAIPADLDAGAMPRVWVRGQIEAGREEPVTLARGSSSAGSMVSLPGGPQVYEFRVELIPEPWTLDPETGWLTLEARPTVVRIFLEQIRGDLADARAGQADWRLRTGPRFPPRLVVPVEEPLVLEQLASTIHDGRFWVRALVRSPFGSHDVDAASITGRILAGPDRRPTPTGAVDLVMAKRSYDHDGALRPVNVTWKIHHELLDHDASGEYVFEFRARNLQGTYELVDTIPLNIAQFEGTATLPGPGPAALALAPAGLALARGRR